jgi:peroxiredoxin
MNSQTVNPARPLWVCLALALMQGCAISGQAQSSVEIRMAQARPPGASMVPPPGLQRASGKPAGLTAEMESFLKKLIETYQKAESYRDHGQVRLVQQNGRVKTTTEMPMELAFERPNRLLLDAGQYSVVCDGKALTFVAPDLRQYMTSKGPERLEKKHLLAGSILGGADEGHPEVIDFLVRPDVYDALLAQIAKVSWAPEASVDGVLCRVLAYETLQGTRVTNYIDATRMVLLKVEAETFPPALGALPSAVAAPPQIPTRLSYALAPVELNLKLNAAAFALRVPSGFKRVAQLGAEGGSPDPLGGAPSAEQSIASEGAHLLGRPAPAVRGKDLTGKPLEARELDKRVVLLFFWSLNGGEYCLTSIPIVQQVAEHFRDRPDVLVLGISGDPDKAQVVAHLMERKKAAFRTLLDEDMAMQRGYELGGLPSFVVIGADGQVKWAKLGAPPTLKDDLIREIQRRLPKGKAQGAPER